ncbi:winged helix-turn-helix transcriptional regulator [Halomarina pelagica]|uniref:winged helix-turn-helix transcriptional regulator n=1 Tax=Halomarina pelagica TaxID=2961599 RepID=UPI0020C312B4|nr:winged helix-turn-helix transcriptional regulator [Halomarina sp. BND7]
MTTHTVRNTADKLPFEIRAAVSAFDNGTRQAIMITLLNEGKLRFSELRDSLSDEDEQLHNQTLTNALEALQEGGLVDKRVADTAGEQVRSYYEVSEYGERFVDCLLNSLGSVDSFTPRFHYEQVENIHNQEYGPVAVEAPVDLGLSRSEDDEPAPIPDQ